MPSGLWRGIALSGAVALACASSWALTAASRGGGAALLAEKTSGNSTNSGKPISSLPVNLDPSRLGSGAALQNSSRMSSVEASALEDGEDRRRRFARRGTRPPNALPAMPIDGDLSPAAPLTKDGVPYEFYFTRAAYSGFGWRGYASWTIDYPKADRQFLVGVQRLVSHLDAYSYEHPILLNDPDLLKFPFLYAVEVGYMSLSDEEVVGLRRYLEAGGFLVIDDFWGSVQMANLKQEMARILPDRPIVDVPLDHPVFHCFYDVTKLVQVPNLAKGREMALGLPGATTHEEDGYLPKVKGVFDDDGRLMVVINWNSDLGDAWEWAENALYPLEYSTYAYQVGVNYIVYAMTH